MFKSRRFKPRRRRADLMLFRRVYSICRCYDRICPVVRRFDASMAINYQILDRQRRIEMIL